MRGRLVLVSLVLSGLILGFVTTLSCTENSRVRTFGGSLRVQLPPGRRLVNATWKDFDLWYLTRPMRPGELPETSEFQEMSNRGFMEGKVTFQESR